jgi:hypothetical protein
MTSQTKASARCIDEVALYGLPLIDEPLLIFPRQRMDGNFFHTALVRGQRIRGTRFASVLADRS